jgi:phosphatidate cytidylyltransferase
VVFRRELRSAVAASAASAFSVLYIAAPMAMLISMRRSPAQNVLIIFVLFSVWAGDIAAYYVGKNFGRRKLAPVVSPNKTWEGAIASLVGSVVMAIVIFTFERQIAGLFSGYSYSLASPTTSRSLTPSMHQAFSFYAVCLGIVTNIAAQFGDLFESALKRGAQIKDSGSLLPGHGGVLDRIDALFFAIPTVWYYANFYPHLVYRTL